MSTITGEVSVSDWLSKDLCEVVETTSEGALFLDIDSTITWKGERPFNFGVESLHLEDTICSVDF